MRLRSRNHTISDGVVVRERLRRERSDSAQAPQPVEGLSRAEAGLVARMRSWDALARPDFRLIQPNEQASCLKGLSLDVRRQPSDSLLILGGVRQRIMVPDDGIDCNAWSETKNESVPHDDRQPPNRPLTTNSKSSFLELRLRMFSTVTPPKPCRRSSSAYRSSVGTITS